MTSISLLVIIASLVALLVVGTEDMGSGHTVFANRSGHVAFTNKGINVQTDTNQDQGCESAGGTSGITNACTATSTPGSTTQVTLGFGSCSGSNPFTCSGSSSAGQCNNLGCTSVTCVGSISGVSNCVTNNGIQLTSCTTGAIPGVAGTGVFCTLTKTHTVPGTGITQSGGVSGEGG
jgi:hypothetical protein